MGPNGDISVTLASEDYESGPAGLCGWIEVGPGRRPRYSLPIKLLDQIAYHLRGAFRALAGHVPSVLARNAQ
jgi:hypothetical protein